MFERWRRKGGEQRPVIDALPTRHSHCAAALVCGNTVVYRNPNAGQARPADDEQCAVVAAPIDAEGQTDNVSVVGDEPAACALTGEQLPGDPRP